MLSYSHSKVNVPSGSASVFVASHDSERGNNGGSLNFNDGAVYTLANVFALCVPLFFGMLDAFTYSSIVVLIPMVRLNPFP